MKVAVCISGQVRGSYLENIKNLQDYFPFDFFYGKWKGSKSINLPCADFEVPDMHYNPGLDFKVEEPIYYKNARGLAKRKSDLFLHRTKQILIHSLLLQKVPYQYDMIIRTRFDALINTKQNKDVIMDILDMSYRKRKAIGFNTPKFQHDAKFRNLQMLTGNHPRRIQYLLDHMIFHRRDMWDHDLVWKLHEEKKLIAAEYGWYQVLSEPYTDNVLDPNHECYLGFCGVEKV